MLCTVTSVEKKIVKHTETQSIGIVTAHGDASGSANTSQEQESTTH